MSEPAVGGTILVTGAAGKTGQAVVRRLAQAGSAVRALVRRREQETLLAELGAVESWRGDLRDRDSLAAAAEGVDAIYHVCPNVHPEEVTIGENAIAAARSVGASRFVFHSVLHPQIEAMPHHWRKMRVEERLFESGLAFTILQPAAYMQNVLGQWQSIAERGIFPVPYPTETRIAMVDLEDVAEAAAHVLIDPGHEGATYELCGPELLSQTEVAAVMERRLGRSVRPEAVPFESWEESARTSGLGDERIDALLKMFRYYARFGLRGSPRALGWLLGRPPTAFSSFVDRTAGSR